MTHVYIDNNVCSINIEVETKKIGECYVENITEFVMQNINITRQMEIVKLQNFIFLTLKCSLYVYNYI